jgi:hypothetical protein
MVKQPVTRREFIGTTAAAGAGLLLTSCSPDSGSKPAAAKGAALTKLNIALIGCGAEGQVLLDSLLVIDGIRLAAIVDIWDYNRNSNIRRLKDQGVVVNGYENYEELLAHEKDLQAVIVATPDFWHAPITNACLKAGLHVYCEKMMSNTIEGARSMVQTMRETGKLLQIGHQRRSNPRYLFALNRLVRREICGRLTAAQAQWNRAVTEDLGWPKHSAMSPRKTGQIWFQRHAPVPQLALVQGPRRRAAFRFRRASDRYFQLVVRRPAILGAWPAAAWIITKTTSGMTMRW